MFIMKFMEFIKPFIFLNRAVCEFEVHTSVKGEAGLIEFNFSDSYKIHLKLEKLGS
jgi:hypothetical protein